MRTKIFNILALGAVLLMASCSLHDDKELFDTPAAERLEETVANDKALLESASNGWELHLWTGENYEGGGYTYLMKFNNGKVTVAGDVADAADETATSSYDVIDDQGPVLTVNTFNSIFHKLADPERDADDGEQQDYEFVITRTTNDSIYLRGKKWGNNMVMTRLADDVNWSNEIGQIKAVESAIEGNLDASSSLPLSIITGNDTLGTFTLTAADASRQVTVNTGSTSVDVPYYVSTTGIVLQRPVSVGGVNIQNLTFNADDISFTPTGEASGINIEYVKPADYVDYDDFAGSYRLYYYQNKKWGAIEVTLKPTADRKHFTMSGAINGYDLTLDYDKTSGTLFWPAQYVGTDGSTYVYCLGWSLKNQGYFYFDTSLGMTIRRDMSEEGYFFNISDETSNYNLDSFLLVSFSSPTPSNSSYLGVSSSILWTNGNYGLRYVKYLEKE